VKNQKFGEKFRLSKLLKKNCDQKPKFLMKDLIFGEKEIFGEK